MLKRVIYSSPLGPLTLLSDGTTLTHLLFRNEEPPGLSILDVHKKEVIVLEETVAYLDAYFQGNILQKAPLLSFKGSFFQKTIWEELLKIPYGEVITYGDLARKVAQKTGQSRMSAQAVGSAVGANNIAIIIPCHRVIGAKQKLGGYSGGLNKKEFLLKLEGHDLTVFKK